MPSQFRWFLVFSILLHLLFFWWFRWGPKENNLFAQKPLEVVLATYQVADIEPPQEEKKPDQADLVGSYDSRVTEEMVAPSWHSKDEGRGTKDLYRFDRDLFSYRKQISETVEKDALEGGLSEEFFPDYKRGSRTYLNVLRFPDVQYFVRLKRAFKWAFDPVPVIREHVSFNKIALGNLETVIGVSVDKKGELAELFVFKSSGIAAYDQEVLRTVRASAPFSSPPVALLHGENLLHMTWTFTVYF